MPSPEIADYPLLLEWLTKHNAQCIWYASDWESGRSKPIRHVEGWLVHGALIVITLYAENRGWGIWTETDTTDISKVFADAERRIGATEKIDAAEAVRGVLAKRGLDNRDHVIEEILNALGVGQ